MKREMKMWRVVLGFVFGVAFTAAAPGAFAQSTGAIGLGNTCNDVAREITRNWFELKNFLGDGSTKRPGTRDFRCMSPYSMRNEIQRNVPGMRGKLQCYKVEGMGVCCDMSMNECAAL